MMVLCCPCVIGFILTIVGISYLADATHDSRGDKLQVRGRLDVMHSACLFYFSAIAINVMPMWVEINP